MSDQRFSVANAYRLYVGPPRRSLVAVGEMVGVNSTTISRAFQARNLPLRSRGRTPKTAALPSETDPAVRFILERLAETALSWLEFDDGVRQWMYRPPILNGPGIALVRRNLRRLGYDLAVVPLAEDDDPDERRMPPPQFASGRTLPV